MRYRLEVRIRWRRPGPGDGEQIADVLGILEEADAGSFAVRTSDGKLVVIPAQRALPGRWCHRRRRSAIVTLAPSFPDGGAGDSTDGMRAFDERRQMSRRTGAPGR